jgi:hypothetical protein
MHSNRKQYSSGQQNLKSLQINGQPINDTKEAPDIGLLQSDTIAKTMEINVKQNIKKARRTAAVSINTWASISLKELRVMSSAQALMLQIMLSILAPRHVRLSLSSRGLTYILRRLYQT